MTPKTDLETRGQTAPATTPERLHDRRTTAPRADIYETPDAIHIVANMAGVDEKGVDITLDRSELTITGRPASQAPEGMELAYCEYAVADYERRFILSEEIDRDGIIATVKDGVLDLTLPKSTKARTRRIPVTAA
mgnify:CR=1 FL=1